MKNINELSLKELKERIDDLEITISRDEAELEECYEELKQRKNKKKK